MGLNENIGGNSVKPEACTINVLRS